MTCFWKENRSKIKLENCHLPVSKVRGEIFWKRSYTQQSCSCFSNIFYYVLTHVVVVKRQGPLLPWERSRSLSFEEACTGRTNQAPGRLRDSSTNCFVSRTLHFSWILHRISEFHYFHKNFWNLVGFSRIDKNINFVECKVFWDCYRIFCGRLSENVA